jgi:hypothetical protein
MYGAAMLQVVPRLSADNGRTMETPNFLLLFGVLMLGAALGALLTLIQHKTITARILKELENHSMLRSVAEPKTPETNATKPDAA